MNKRVIKKTLSSVRGHAGAFAAVMILAAGYAGLSLYVPLIFGDVIDLLSDGPVDFPLSPPRRRCFNG